MKEEDIKKLFETYNKLENQAAKDAAKIRKQAHGILAPEVIEKIVKKNDKLPENKRQGIVLAYGMMGQVSYTAEELKRFLDALESFQKEPHMGARDAAGVPYQKLFLASRATDIERSRLVRSATLYQRKGNIVYFQVSGNSKRYYRVQIRLEEWNSYIANAVPAMAAAQAITRGRISFECPCGRHQYWYRYMATLGNYAIEPLEHGFPKIRNPGLFGCCCKHVLKVLKTLVSPRIIPVLAKELERERNRSGFSSSRRGGVLSEENLLVTMTFRARQAFLKYAKESEELKSRLTPRNGKKVKVNKMLLNGLKTILLVARANPALEKPMLDGFAKTHNLTREDVDKISREHKL